MPTSQPVILYDGVCYLCNGVVNFLLKADKQKRFKFSPLQSDFGQSLLKQHHLPADDFESFVVVEGDTAYQRSSAALKVATSLGLPWSLAGIGWILPRPVRDAFYNVIAKNRYQWFGQHDSCLMPTPEIKERFLL